MKLARRQQGLAAVEFAVVGATAMIVLFGCIEVGRMLFVWNAAAEATRRGARVAVVSTDAAAAKAAVLVYSGQLNNLAADNIAVSYYDATGTTVPPAAAQFVTVSIQNYTHTLLIPGIPLTLAVPDFATTLPAESMGIPF